MVRKAKTIRCCGSHGTILTSHDGAKWIKQNTKIKANLAGIAYSPVSNRFVVVGDGYIMVSDDAASWKIIREGVEEMREGKIYDTRDWFRDVIWSEKTEKFIATTEDNNIYRSVDGGKWQKMEQKTNNIDQIILLDVQGCSAGGTCGYQEW